MKVVGLIFAFWLTCAVAGFAPTFGVNLVHINTDPGDVTADGRIDTILPFTGGAIPDGWVVMTDAQVAANYESTAEEQERIRKVEMTKPARQRQVVEGLEDRLESSGGMLKHMRLIEAQCEMLRGLWRMAGESALTSRLTGAQFRRMEKNDAQLARVLDWIRAAKDAVSDIATNAAPVRPSLPDPGELEP